MEKYRDIRIEDFNYSLPLDRIAKYPLNLRDESKLLVYKSGKIENDTFINIPGRLESDKSLIFNNTKVICSRLMFRKHTGASIEIFCIEPYSPVDYQLSLSSTTEVDWICIVGNLKKWKSGPLLMNLTINGEQLVIEAYNIGREQDNIIVRFKWNNNGISFSEILEASGHMPVPPYLNRDDEPIDKLRYQTIYSQNKGSVAAPTAGLHFSDEVLNTIGSKGLRSGNITLHVGAGTFIPVKSDTIGGHTMHREHFFVSNDTIELLRQGDIIAVGTTSVRCVETLYHLGNKLLNGYKSDSPELSCAQWEVYEDQTEHSRDEVLDAILNHLKSTGSEILQASTSIIIVPGYRFRMVKGLITNFHMPSSTLLLLVSALIGEDWKKVYKHALENDYRFLSYGDSSLLLP
jgi:S-adenosylmethionine:tRNA ribosyltransferase-isomerase